MTVTHKYQYRVNNYHNNLKRHRYCDSLENLYETYKRFKSSKTKMYERNMTTLKFKVISVREVQRRIKEHRKL